MLSYEQSTSGNYFEMNSNWIKIFDLKEELGSKYDFDFFYKYEEPIIQIYRDNHLNKYFLINLNKVYLFLVQSVANVGNTTYRIHSLHETMRKVLSEDKNLDFFKKLTTVVLEAIKNSKF